MMEDTSDLMIHPTSIIDEGVKLDPGVRIWHFCHIREGARIGSGSSLGQNVVVGPAVEIGSGCRIQNNVSIFSGVTLESNVFIGPSCVFTNVRNPRAGINRQSEFESTLIRQGATIGANATILCGIEIGAFAMIGAGSVVTRTVSPHALMVGNPAKQIGWVGQSGETLDSDLVCPRTGEKYIIEKGFLRREEVDE
tara:strand:+ start:364 stop:948 length:585 start_codon:yes stop_codon:yes gene_type:complete